jgi:CheY-like chemotaxis protein
MRTSRPVLLVEDDDVDAMTVKRALKELNVTNPLVHTVNGEDALEYLRSHQHNGKPCLVLLDLNMPKMNGIEFLKVVKDNGELRSIPVVVLTTSREQQDKIESFKLSVAGYMLKSVDYHKFVDTIRTIDLYWTLSELPGNGD